MYVYVAYSSAMQHFAYLFKMQTSWGQLVLRSTEENFQQKICKLFED